MSKVGSVGPVVLALHAAIAVGLNGGGCSNLLVQVSSALSKRSSRIGGRVSGRSSLRWTSNAFMALVADFLAFLVSWRSAAVVDGRHRRRCMRPALMARVMRGYAHFGEETAATSSAGWLVPHVGAPFFGQASRDETQLSILLISCPLLCWLASSMAAMM